ncbi:MAG: hypothetical protein ACP5QT_04945 [Brevinematia bacterium]
MAQERMVFYQLDEKDSLKFRIKNYNFARPFVSFFPGIAGIMGIPVWCFYVNRGQCISSFGFDTKDGALMEFQPANKAYRLTPLYGFRTFIKIEDEIYEPFNETFSNRKYRIENEMIISPFDLTLTEENKTLGLRCEVNYFTIPNEPVGGLARILTITNNFSGNLTFELIDGLPVIMPSGLTEWAMKNMSRTIEAWYTVDNLEKNSPYYRLKVTFLDVAEVKPVLSGNFYFSFIENEKRLPVIIEPDRVFGNSTDLSYPFSFKKRDFRFPEVQYSGNRTPSALSFAKVSIKAGEKLKLYSLAGRTEKIEILNERLNSYSKREFFEKKQRENEGLIKTLMDRCFIVSSRKEFDSYARQSFLDNLLRGGFPYTITSDKKRDVLYLFSRRHGDPERDYNNFKLQPAYFSQGNGAYRDINQNRRNDVFFNPDVEHFNILYFMNLIQLDGYNPLVVKGVSYSFDRSRISELEKWLTSDLVEEIAPILGKNFIPSDIIKFFEENNVKLKKGNLFDFLSFLLTNSRKVEEAEHGEGFWTDHWFYNLDLIEAFEAVFPDRMRFLLVEEKNFSFYDNDEIVLPRREKYVLNYAGLPRQYNALRKDKEKTKLINSRDIEPHKVRTNYGKGEIYKTILLCKLISLGVMKLSTLDPENIGIEMEAGKPNWNDSINGLPGLFGSSLNETLELKRLFLLLKRLIEDYDLKKLEISIPVEIYDFMSSLCSALKDNLSGKITNFEFWDICSTEREIFREKTKNGIDGKEIRLKISSLIEFIDIATEKLTDSIERAYDKENLLYTTYFYYDLVKYKLEKGIIIPEKFEMKRVVPFLESEVHYLKIENDKQKAKNLALAVKNSEIYDRKLKMYKLSASTESQPLEIGRIKAFTPGWLENESVFSHMEYKYLLELLKSGLFEMFYEEIKSCLIPFLNPEIYGRSILENVSFIVSSSNPDSSIHGAGYYPRLSGTTSEFYNMLLVMAFGKKPFYLNEEGKLCLSMKPALASWLFTNKDREVEYYSEKGVRKLYVPANSFAISWMKETIVLFKNPARKDTFKEDTKILSYTFFDGKKKIAEIIGEVISEPYSREVREGKYSMIEVLFR